MNEFHEIRPVLQGEGLRFGIVASRFNERLCDLLVDGAKACLRHHGVDGADGAVVRVPGAFELPLALAELAASHRYDGLVALGVVIRGETPHFDYVCSEASRGITQVSLDHRLPIGFGLLTCDDQEQAAARAGGRGPEDHGKGWDAAVAALEMAALQRALRSHATPARAAGSGERAGEGG